MKKLMYLFVLSVLFVSCEKEEVDSYKYSAAQKHALNVLKGKFTDTSIYSKGYGADIIDFYNVYSTPVLEYYEDKTLKDITFGECSYYDAYAKTSTNYYYYIYEDASRISLNYKGGDKDKSLYRVFDITLIGENSFYMQDSNLSVPYNFVKK